MESMKPPAALPGPAAPVPGRGPDPALARLLACRHHDPFSLLGRHPVKDGQIVVRALLPGTESARVSPAGPELRRLDGTDLFVWEGPATAVPIRYQLRLRDGGGRERTIHDPYVFPPQLREADLAAFNGGTHDRAWTFLGSHPWEVDGVAGVLFAVWAPNAERVSVVGDFNGWDGRWHPMRVRGGSGVWELFIPGVAPGALYKYEIRNRDTGELLLKADPFGQCQELRPATASVVPAPSRHAWGDSGWLERRAGGDWLHSPLSVYEVHLASWRRGPGGRLLDYREAADALVPYVRDLGFTHVELLPLTEHPLDESWGYQPTGYFAATRRHGDADDLRYLVDRCHREGIGVILDWVPGHFPRDSHGLARFDGTALYEYGDPRKASHPDWGTLVFNYDRREVRSFLLSSARYWLEEFHLDGLRVDAVASMLYLDYSRRAGEWAPNIHGGNENLEAISLLREMNVMTHREVPGSLTIAEESTAWPGVSRPVDQGGLGFSMKWNMGWMHDTLAYLGRDPVHRRHHHDQLTFGPLYAFSENFVLPFSHDEVVHMKGSMLAKMPGDHWQRFANLRLAYTYQWTYPGKKLLFMGCEFGQPWEWDAGGELGWHLLADPAHGGLRALVRDLNGIYRSRPALHALDFESAGFRWLRWDDAEHSTLSYLRLGGGGCVAVILNFTPVPRNGWRVGVPGPGLWREIFNSDSRFYGGSDLGNPLPLAAEAVPWMDQPWSVQVTVPPLGGIILEQA
jgi:1,4-alpha-glucan branching enzyme